MGNMLHNDVETFMMGAKRYYNASFFADCFQRLDNLRDSGETCDIRLLASTQEISAHKLVLATVSEYFKNAIYGLFSHKSEKTVLEFKEVKYETLSQIVNYMYSGTIDINLENVYDLFNAADYYLIDFLKEKCLDFLLENICSDNCVRFWLIANNCKHEKLGTATRNFIFSNLESVSNTKDFLSLSNEEIFELFKLWPKYELSDSMVASLLSWTDYKINREETFMNILIDIPHSSISEDFLDNVLSNNELIQNNTVSNKWMMNIYKEKLKSYKLLQADPKDKLTENTNKSHLKKEKKYFKVGKRVSTAIFDQQILLVARDSDFVSHNFYKYNINDGGYNLIHKIRHNYHSDYEIYKKWIYVIGLTSGRFPIDDIKQNSFESRFCTSHGEYLRSSILNDSLHIFGGGYFPRIGSTIDLNTAKTTSFVTLKVRQNSGVAVHEGSIYICGGLLSENIERFDPREGKTSFFADIPSNRKGSFCSAAILSNELYCSGYEHKMVDLRNRNSWSEIEPPVRNLHAECLVSSNGKLYTYSGTNIYEYNNILQSWKCSGYFPVLNGISKAISLQ